MPKLENLKFIHFCFPSSDRVPRFDPDPNLSFNEVIAIKENTYMKEESKIYKDQIEQNWCSSSQLDNLDFSAYQFLFQMLL